MGHTCFSVSQAAQAKFDLLWYLQNGAHLLAGSTLARMGARLLLRWDLNGLRKGGFAKKHRTTVFKPFKIQELVTDAILQPGPAFQALASFAFMSEAKMKCWPAVRGPALRPWDLQLETVQDPSWCLPSHRLALVKLQWWHIS